MSASATPSLRTASLFADRFCGEGTKLIYYVEAGTVLSRKFTSKDTHSPRGDLLVVYGDNSRNSYKDAVVARQTTALLGFSAPSFTHGADLILPAELNEELRKELVMDVSRKDGTVRSSPEVVIESYDNVSVPQLLAALAYSRNTPKMWFVNPQAWVTKHLFKTASIWDIPLVKPRFACAVEPKVLESQGDEQVAEVLVRSLDFFTKGGACEDGLIVVDSDLVPVDHTFG